MSDQTNKAIASFEEVVLPVIEWLARNHHPHVTIIIDSTHAELVEGVLSINTKEFLQD